MKLAHYSVEQLKKDIIAVIGKYLDLKEYRVFFFGSRVNGKGDDRADIDVGIEGPRPVPGAAMVEIREALENLPTLYKIDVVDFKEVSDGFRRVAFRHTETINP